MVDTNDHDPFVPEESTPHRFIEDRTGVGKTHRLGKLLASISDPEMQPFIDLKDAHDSPDERGDPR